jgi:hypothetical protein
MHATYLDTPVTRKLGPGQSCTRSWSLLVCSYIFCVRLLLRCSYSTVGFETLRPLGLKNKLHTVVLYTYLYSYLMECDSRCGRTTSPRQTRLYCVCAVLHSVAQCCTVLHSVAQCCTVLHRVLISLYKRLPAKINGRFSCCTVLHSVAQVQFLHSKCCTRTVCFTVMDRRVLKQLITFKAHMDRDW